MMLKVNAYMNFENDYIPVFIFISRFFSCCCLLLIYIYLYVDSAALQVKVFVYVDSLTQTKSNWFKAARVSVTPKI